MNKNLKKHLSEIDDIDILKRLRVDIEAVHFYVERYKIDRNKKEVARKVISNISDQIRDRIDELLINDKENGN